MRQCLILLGVNKNKLRTIHMIRTETTENPNYGRLLKCNKLIEIQTEDTVASYMLLKNKNDFMDWEKCVIVGEDAGSLQQGRGSCARSAPVGVCAVARRFLSAACTGTGRISALAQPCRTHARSYCGLSY